MTNALAGTKSPNRKPDALSPVCGSAKRIAAGKGVPEGLVEFMILPPGQEIASVFGIKTTDQVNLSIVLAAFSNPMSWICVQSPDANPNIQEPGKVDWISLQPAR